MKKLNKVAVLFASAAIAAPVFEGPDRLFSVITLAAPHHRQALGTWSTAPQGGLDGCDFNPDAPDYQRFPKARDVTFLRVTLEAGDLLFLPEGWFHQVESVSTSLSVNFW